MIFVSKFSFSLGEVSKLILIVIYSISADYPDGRETVRLNGQLVRLYSPLFFGILVYPLFVQDCSCIFMRLF